MGKVTDSFFDEKKAWSIAKDDLLKHYLNTYMVKLFSSRRPTIYLDCFAGAGKFGEDNLPYEEKVDGSPIIALSAMHEASDVSRADPKPIRLACFIEPEHHHQLETNIRMSKFSSENYLIYPTAYPGAIPSFLDDIFRYWKNPNLFCYLDPFGVKYLEFETFNQIRSRNFHSLEFLINFNSFGFFRYACGAWEIKIRETDIANDEEMAERDPLDENGKGDRLEKLDSVMGIPEWRHVIYDYKHGHIDGYIAECKLAEMYKQQLKRSLGFQYVLSIPIRFRESTHPKYRMIYATNHADGAVIMGDVMRKRQDYLFEQYSLSSSGGCLNLFEREELLGGPSVEDSVIAYLRGKEELRGKEFFAGFYDEKFITAHLGNILRKLEENNKIIIRREPKTTEKNKPRKFYIEDKDKRLYIRLNE